MIHGLYWIKKKKKGQLYTYPSDRINYPGAYSFNTIIKIVCKRNRELKTKHCFLGVENLSFAVITSKCHSLSQKWKGGPNEHTIWASWPIHITVLKTKVIYYMLQVPTRQCQNDIYFFACFVIIPLGGVTGLVAFGFFFSAGFKICKDWKDSAS